MTLNRREGKQLDTPGRAWLIALALATYLAACSDGTTPVDGGATDAGAREASADTGAGGPARILPPKTGCYLGMFPGWGEYEDSISVSTLQEFRQLTGRKVAFTAFSNAWGRDYSSNKQLLAIAGHGAIPMLRIMPFGSPYWSKPFGFQDKYSLERIIKGEHDKLIAAWADVVKKFGKPVMVTFAVEMNGNWFPWSGWFQGGAKTDGYALSISKADVLAYLDTLDALYAGAVLSAGKGSCRARVRLERDDLQQRAVLHRVLKRGNRHARGNAPLAIDHPPPIAPSQQRERLARSAPKPAPSKAGAQQSWSPEASRRPAKLEPRGRRPQASARKGALPGRVDGRGARIARRADAGVHLVRQGEATKRAGMPRPSTDEGVH